VRKRGQPFADLRALELRRDVLRDEALAEEEAIEGAHRRDLAADRARLIGLEETREPAAERDQRQALRVERQGLLEAEVPQREERARVGLARRGGAPPLVLEPAEGTSRSASRAPRSWRERRRLGRRLEESRETSSGALPSLLDRTVVDRDVSEVDARVVLGVGVGELVVLLVVTLVCGLPALATFVVLALTIVDTVRQEGALGGSTSRVRRARSATAPRRRCVCRRTLDRRCGAAGPARGAQLEIDKWGKPIRDR
jgi:hypothetical protein